MSVLLLFWNFRDYFSVLTFKEISLNYGNLDLFKEVFKEMVFLRKF